MPIVLTRVDDRLIHGQVVEGWLRIIQAQRVLVVSDQAAGDAFQAGLMRLALPPEVELTVLSVEEAGKALRAGQWAEERVMVLLPGLPEARRLAEGGWLPESLNLGGLHDAPGRTSRTPCLFLGPPDEADVRFLLGKKIEIETRPLPSDDRVPVKDYLS